VDSLDGFCLADVNGGVLALLVADP